ncbi:hypothetical protein [Pseudooceanicola sp.]|uniref:hypothetical protein n=1 Tax=Pseudooceanicola sp. TaxID=1914328 RepID=UPI00262C32C6|nr:hypothetical protein [Pseudooceanicola sp.]MDF1854404.1 hypothetical protein [Pseudooceanicola sp.]
MILRLISAASLFCAGTAAMAFDQKAINDKCDAKWGTDFRMVKYCREHQQEAGRKVDDLRARVVGNGTAEIVLRDCEKKWGTDYRMVAYCYEKQADALSELSNSRSDIPKNVHDLISNNCSEKWGNNFRMVAYCIEKQTQAWKEIQ